jgi:dihydropteroate synthase
MDSKDNLFSVKKTMNLGGSLVDLSTPTIMGILNITPDSFFDGGCYLEEKTILHRCEKLISEGATFIDIGAYSSRPGADDVSAEEELKRLFTALRIIKKQFSSVFISIDTFRSEVAEKTIQEFGSVIINDISAGSIDPNMFAVAGKYGVPYIMMHMRGTPKTMQSQTEYKDMVNEIIRYFAEKTDDARKSGIHDLVIDPGFGFSKTLEQNFELLEKLNHFKILEKPILVGLSRKSMIYKTLNTDPEHALAGTIAANTIALLKGASILRVHDVKEASDAITIVKALKFNIN